MLFQSVQYETDFIFICKVKYQHIDLHQNSRNLQNRCINMYG